MRVQYMQPEQVDIVLDIADEAFGRGYISKADLKEFSPIVVEELETEEVKGFTLARITERGEGIIKAVAISPENRGRGYGTKLLEFLMDKLPTPISVCAWQKSGEPDAAISPLLLSAKFELTGSVEEYWFADSVTRDYDCTHCKGKCRCTAKMYIKR